MNVLLNFHRGTLWPTWESGSFSVGTLMLSARRAHSNRSTYGAKMGGVHSIHFKSDLDQFSVWDDTSV